MIDEKLNREMALVMKLASLGHAARNKANRKVRQPLAEAAFSVAARMSSAVAGEIRRSAGRRTECQARARAGCSRRKRCRIRLNPLPKQLGQKYGSRFPAIRKALLALDADEPRPSSLLAGRAGAGERGRASASRFCRKKWKCARRPRRVIAVAAEGAYLAALVTDLTPELVREGLAREFVRRVQDLRKQADLDIADRIKVYYQATPGLREAVEAFREYIMNETLAVELLDQDLPHGLTATTDTFDGEEVKVALARA